MSCILTCAGKRHCPRPLTQDNGMTFFDTIRNKDSTLLSSCFVNIYCTICCLWPTKVHVWNRKKNSAYLCLMLLYLAEVVPVWQMPLQMYLCKVLIQNTWVILFKPGYGNQNYTCFAHVTQGFICLIHLPVSDSSFHCHVAPSAGCMNEHSTETIYKPGLAVGRDSNVCQGPSADGAVTVHWQM